MENSFEQDELESGGGFDIKRLIGFLLKYWYFIVIGLFLGGLTGYLQLRYAVPVYEASSQILINVNRQGDPISELLDQPASIRNRFNNPNDQDLIKIQSGQFLKFVEAETNLSLRYYQKGRIRGIVEVDNRGLPIEVTFDSTDFSKFGRFIYIKSVDGDTSHYEYGSTDDDGNPYDITQASYGEMNEDGFRLERKLNFSEVFIKKLTQEMSVKAIENSMNIRGGEYEFNIKITSTVSSYSVLLAQLIPVAYIKYSNRQKKKSFEGALKFVDERRAELNDSLNRIEKKLIDFRIVNNLYTSENLSSSMNVEFIEGLGKLEDLKAELIRIKKFQEYLKFNIDDALQNPPVTTQGTEYLIGEQLNVLLELLRTRRNLRITVNPDADLPMRQALDDDIELAVKKITATLDQAVSVINQEIMLVAAQQSAIKKELQRYPGVEHKFLKMEREYQLFKRLYDVLLEKRLDFGLKAATVLSDHELMEIATNATKIRPDSKSLMIISIMVGLMIPIAVLLILFMMDKKLRDIDQLKDLTALPLLGVVPNFAATNFETIFNVPKSILAETFRSIRTNLNYVLGKESNVILVTSSVPGEGKTFCSENIASIFAYSEKTVCVVGCDLRRPQLFKEIGLNNDKGLSELLSGQVALDEVLSKTKHPNLHVITSGATPPNPSELLESKKMDELIDHLSSIYDIVVMDTTPINIVTDANILLKKVDYTVFIMRQNVTSKDAVKYVNEKFSEPDFRDKIGIIFNDFSSKKSFGGKYGYGYGYGDGYGYGYGYNDNPS